MGYRLSKIVPVHFTTVSGRERENGLRSVRSSWWQWRDRVYRVRTTDAGAWV